MMLGFVPLLTKVAHGGNPQDRTFALPNLQISDRAAIVTPNTARPSSFPHSQVMPDGSVKTISTLAQWQDFNTWKVPYKNIENWTGTKFFDIPSLSSSLLADSEGDSIIVDNSSISDTTGISSKEFVDSFTYVVQDNDGQFSNPATVTVTVDNVAPTITEIQLPDNITEGTETTITAIVSDPGNDELTYTWDFGDNTDIVGANGHSPLQGIHTFVDNGNYSATLSVNDPYGGSDTRTFEIIVNNAAPVVEAGSDQTINEGEAINFNGNYSDAGINDTHTFAWDFGDGTIEYGRYFVPFRKREPPLER